MMKNKIQAGIVGGAGYTGGELIRILLNHPQAVIPYTRYMQTLQVKLI